MRDDELRQQLNQSKASRLRAWRALQQLRELLSALRDEPLPPPQWPFRFDEEGAALRTALLDHLQRVAHLLGDMVKQVDLLKPYLTHKDDASFPFKLQDYNRLLDRVWALEAACRYVEDKIRRRRAERGKRPRR